MGLIEDNREMNSVITAWAKLFERIAVMQDPQLDYVLKNVEAGCRVLRKANDEGAE